MRDILMAITVLVLAGALAYSIRSMRTAEREAYDMKLQLKCMEALGPKK